MKYAIDSVKNTYKINEYLLNEEQGTILKDLNRWFFDKTVFVGFLAVGMYGVLLYMFIYFYGTSTVLGNGEVGTGFIFMLVVVILWRALDLYLQYLKLKKTFKTREEFLYFLNILAYNRYTMLLSVSFESVEKDFKKIKKGYPEAVFFFKYFYLLGEGQKQFFKLNKRDDKIDY